MRFASNILMISTKPISFKKLGLVGAFGLLCFNNQISWAKLNVPDKTLAAAKAISDDSIAPSVGPSTNSPASTPSKMMLQGKAEVTEHFDNNILAWQASQVYKQGVASLSAKRFALAADCFRLAGNQFAGIPDNEKYLAESKYAEAQARRLLGQKHMAIDLYKEAIDLFKRFDPESAYLQAAMDNLNTLTPRLQAQVVKHELKSESGLKGSVLQTVDKNIILKGRLTDSGAANLKAEKGKVANDVLEAHIKKTVLQAFVKMTCLETAELGSNYYTAAERYVPVQANNRIATVTASTGFLAPIINIKLNGRYYNVGIDLPELSASRRSVYLVTDGKNLLAIDPATYDVWKLYANFTDKNAVFDWHKLTHKKDLPARIDISSAKHNQ